MHENDFREWCLIHSSEIKKKTCQSQIDSFRNLFLSAKYPKARPVADSRKNLTPLHQLGWVARVQRGYFYKISSFTVIFQMQLLCTFLKLFSHLEWLHTRQYPCTSRCGHSWGSPGCSPVCHTSHKGDPKLFLHIHQISPACYTSHKGGKLFLHIQSSN